MRPCFPTQAQPSWLPWLLILATLAICNISIGHQAASTSPKLEDDVVLMQATWKVNNGNRLQGSPSDVPMTIKKDGADVVRQSMLGETLNVNKTNLLFIRIMKTASSTCGGIIRRIGAHHGLNGVYVNCVWIADIGEPAVSNCHGALNPDIFGPNPVHEPIDDKGVPNYWNAIPDLKLPTFLWTMIRDPVDRAFSLFYYMAEKQHICSPYDCTFYNKKRQLQQYVEDDGPYAGRSEANLQFRFLRSSVADTVDDVIQKYGLIAVMDRFDESVVVLAATLKIPLSDVFYVASKVSSQKYVDPEDNTTHSSHPKFSEEPEDVQKYVNESFKPSQQLDYELLQKANDLLDAKIADMKLEPAIQKFQDVLEFVQSKCGECVEPNSGYYKDQGCRYKCLDQYAYLLGRDTCEWCL
mmetsp:Transcript_10951/g.19687  ORF Transcript_10951/g.19687 Transcript_10951/m.19687 type:complete len:410 (+) Transcript_10951:42-1271(+)